MFLTFPWRPTKRVVVVALMLTIGTFVVVLGMNLLPSGTPREVVRFAFYALVFCAVLRGINIRLGRAREEGFTPRDNDR
jgi:hypothetical protein